jgi:hypothetical protein
MPDGRKELEKEMKKRERKEEEKRRDFTMIDSKFFVTEAQRQLLYISFVIRKHIVLY